MSIVGSSPSKHVKHIDSLDVQIRTKFLDMYGHEMEGVIEYDPATGYGKRIKDAKLGLVEDFYSKDGSVELDGQNFDDTNYDGNHVDAIRTVINMKVNRSKDPGTYDDLIKHHTEQIKKQKASPVVQPFTSSAAPTVQQQIEAAPLVMIAAETIKPGDKLMIDETGAVRKFNDNVYHQQEEAKKSIRLQS